MIFLWSDEMVSQNTVNSLIYPLIPSHAVPHIWSSVTTPLAAGPDQILFPFPKTILLLADTEFVYVYIFVLHIPKGDAKLSLWGTLQHHPTSKYIFPSDQGK